MLKYLVVPALWTFERRWVRRTMVVLALPQEVLRALKDVVIGARGMWIVSDQECANVRAFVAQGAQSHEHEGLG